MAATGETLTGIAHNAGMSRYSLDRWRKSPEKVPPHKAQRLAEALGYQDWRELTIKPPPPPHTPPIAHKKKSDV